MYTSESNCNVMSACEWQYNACSYKSSGSSGSSTSCPSGQYWNGSSCTSSDSGSSGSGSTGGGCASGQYWNGSACVTSGSGSTDYSSMQSGCTSAGGTWDSTSNYCRMPSASAASPLAYLCPTDHEWSGGYCVLLPKGNESFVASVFSAFLSLFGI